MRVNKPQGEPSRLSNLKPEHKLKTHTVIAGNIQPERFRKQFSKIFVGKTCDVQIVKKDAASIQQSGEAYFEILRRWDKRDLYFYKGFRILIIAENNKLDMDIFLDAKHKQVKAAEFIAAIKCIRDYNPVCKVLVGQNNPKKPVAPTEQETKLARLIKKTCDDLKVNIVDQLIVSGTECFSFVENDYMEKLQPVTVK